MERLRGQRRGAKKIPPDHLYSSTLIWGIVKNQNPNVSADGRLSSRIAPTASRSVSSAGLEGRSALGGAIDYVVRGKMIGGFALVAYPAEYGNSGVMTFVVNHQGVVFQKDLGLSIFSNSEEGMADHRCESQLAQPEAYCRETPRPL